MVHELAASINACNAHRVNMRLGGLQDVGPAFWTVLKGQSNWTPTFWLAFHDFRKHLNKSLASILFQACPNPPSALCRVYLCPLALVVLVCIHSLAVSPVFYWFSRCTDFGLACASIIFSVSRTRGQWVVGRRPTKCLAVVHTCEDAVHTVCFAWCSL